MGFVFLIDSYVTSSGKLCYIIVSSNLYAISLTKKVTLDTLKVVFREKNRNFFLSFLAVN